MGKITVKHYLNESDLKGVKNKEHFLSPEDGNFKRHVYVQVTVKRQVNRLRSHANKYVGNGSIMLGLTKKAFAEALRNENSEVGKAIAIESKVITDVINYLKPFDRVNFTLRNFASIYEIATDDMPALINAVGKHLLMQNFDNQWNAVEAIINWDKSFVEILEGLYLIGQSNKAFRESILDNDQTQANLTSIKNIQTFIEESNIKWSDNDSSLLSIGLYWFRDNWSKKFIDYLLQKNKITTDQVSILEESFRVLEHSVVTELERLSTAG